MSKNRQALIEAVDKVLEESISPEQHQKVVRQYNEACELVATLRAEIEELKKAKEI